MKLFFILTLFLGIAWILSALAVNLLWPTADNRPRGKSALLRPFARLLFLFGLVFAVITDRVSGRRVAFNALLTPSETSRGTQSMIPDNGVTISFRNALVKYGSDDRHFTTIASSSDVPCGILLNDQVDAGEADVSSPVAGSASYTKKDVALFGLYHESLPSVATAAIAAYAFVIADAANPGQVIQLPSASGTYIVVGRSRFAVVNALDPVSIIHCLPFALTH